MNQVVALETLLGFVVAERFQRRHAQRALHQGQGHQRRRGQRAHLLDHIDQLAHVAGPWRRHQGRQGIGSEAIQRFLVLGRQFLQEMVRQQGDVFAALGQRRQGQGHDIEAVIQVFAKLPLAHRHVEVAVRGGQQAHVHRTRLVGADGAHGPLLQHAQQFHLQRQRHVADLI